MIFTLHNFILIASVLLLISVVFSKSSARFGVPTLMLFLLTGFLAGEDGFGKIMFEDFNLAQFIGNIALIFILFSGGMDTKYKDIKPVATRGVVLSILGVILTAFITGFFIKLITPFGILESLLIGSIVSSTDAATVFGMFRSKQLSLKHNLQPTLELESGSNDPIAYFLCTTFIFLVVNQKDESFENVASIGFLTLLVKSMGIGAFCGFFGGKLMKKLINRIKLDVDGLYSVLLISLSMLIFSITDLVGGNGFLAVYLSALVLGNHRFIHKNSLTHFYDGLSWLMQVVLFLAIGLLVTPHKLLPVLEIGIAISLFMIFIARPIAVLICTIRSKISLKEKAFISWGGLRGATPIVFATYAVVAGVKDANMIFNIVVVISLSSVLLQGTTLTFVASALKLINPNQDNKKSPIAIDISDNFRSELFEVSVEKGSYFDGKSIIDLNIPQSILILLIYRDKKFFSPRGSTKILSGDKLTLMSENKQEIKKIKELCRFDTA